MRLTHSNLNGERVSAIDKTFHHSDPELIVCWFCNNATSTTTKDVLGAENAMSVWKFNGLVMTQKGNSAMSKRVIALYERSYKYRAFYGYFKGWMCVGAYAKNASFTRQINDAVVYDDEHQREMNDAISSLRCTLGYSDMIIRAEEIEE